MKSQRQTGNLPCSAVLCQLTMLYWLFLCPVAIFSRCHLRKAAETIFILHLSPYQNSQNGRFIMPTNTDPSLLYTFSYLLLCSMYLFSLSSRVIFPRSREPTLSSVCTLLFDLLLCLSLKGESLR